MTYKEIMSKLKNFQSKKSRLKSLRAYIDDEKATMPDAGAVAYDKVVVDSSPRNSIETRYAVYFDRINALEERYAALMRDMSEDEEMLNTLMLKLTPTEYEVILNRFMRGLSRAKTARIMKYSPDGLKDIQQRAIKKMSKM